MFFFTCDRRQRKQKISTSEKLDFMYFCYENNYKRAFSVVLTDIAIVKSTIIRNYNFSIKTQNHDDETCVGVCIDHTCSLTLEKKICRPKVRTDDLRCFVLSSPRSRPIILEAETIVCVALLQFVMTMFLKCFIDQMAHFILKKVIYSNRAETF